MKRKGDSQIASLFRQHEAKKIAPSSPPFVVDDEQTEDHAEDGGLLLTCLDSVPPVQSDTESETETEGAAPHPYDAHFLPYDPGERIPIARYNVNDQDDVRRGYILKGPCKPYEHSFPTTKIKGKNRHFSFVWLHDYHWLEYSIGKDAAFCVVCYLFKGRSNGGPGGGTFVKNGFRDWKRPKAFKKHVGGVGSIHNQAQEKYDLFIAPNTKIDNVIVNVSKKDHLTNRKSEWTRIRGVATAFESFDFVFNLHLMLVILGYTNDLSQSLQKRDQDIVNAMGLVRLAKDQMQQMRSHGWEGFLAKVTLFCNKHDIEVPSPEDNYVAHGRSHRYYAIQTNDDRYRREVYLGVVDQIIQELDNRFDEINMELLICMSALNPMDSFASYDKDKVMRLAKFYPDDFSSMSLIRLEFQLETFIGDMRRDERFKSVNHLGELSVKLVETKKHLVYDLVYMLLTLILLLPVATASVERVFSSMTLLKNKLRNSMGDDLLNYCLVTFIERDMFMKVSDEEIVEAFMGM